MKLLVIVLFNGIATGVAVDKLKYLIAGLLLGCLAGGSNAAQQCFSQAGKYGALTVTEDGTGCSQLGATRYGISNWAVVANSNCRFNVSPVVPRAGLRVLLGNINPPEVVSFSLNGSPYSVQAADIDNVTIPPTPAGTISLTGSGVTGNASGGDNGGNGIVSFGSGPSSVSSITVAQTSPPGYGALLVVCADDGPAASAMPVPSLSTWGMLALTLLTSLGGIVFLRRKRS